MDTKIKFMRLQVKRSIIKQLEANADKVFDQIAPKFIEETKRLLKEKFNLESKYSRSDKTHYITVSGSIPANQLNSLYSFADRQIKNFNSICNEDTSMRINGFEDLN